MSTSSSAWLCPPGAEVDVRLRDSNTDLEVEVSDSRPAGGAVRSASAETRSGTEGPPQNEGLGLGIVGMRERMNALGGCIVRARIPYPRSTPDRSSPGTPAKAST